MSDRATTNDQKETARIEAFSDGVFAIAITLLAFDLRVPRLDTGATAAQLAQALLGQWPAYLAFLSSFATILIMWISHHNLFRFVARTDNSFLFINGLLLMLITAVPFPTALIGAYLLDPAGTLACAIYCAIFFLIAVSFNLVWGYATRRGLLHTIPAAASIGTINRRYFVGPLIYLAALGIAFVSELASLSLCVLMAGFYAGLTYTSKPQ